MMLVWHQTSEQHARRKYDVPYIMTQRHEKVIQLLLGKGTDIKVQSGWDVNVLQAALFKGNERMVKLLLGKGVSVNSQDQFFGNVL